MAKLLNYYGIAGIMAAKIINSFNLLSTGKCKISDLFEEQFQNTPVMVHNAEGWFNREYRFYNNL